MQAQKDLLYIPASRSTVNFVLGQEQKKSASHRDSSFGDEQPFS